ncbi:T9SS type B sorting domain-containing protein [Flavobacterium azooxidireducens]|uniref:T9SS type B sorting domain-containing protein n=1 Tax=Flavobacterium azooxidireducens TaxID=1871076 RepID=A0ABY4KBR7_9FLAO|nr:T9SS type B sorting domain-containing protein [Flavobacterium azooxidireducens]UPQ78222.1 T9SS type B sorting domain-containing protein [Flavobacterium azooxidireducens]
MKVLIYTILLLVSSFVLGQNKSSSIGFIENKGQIVDQKGRPNLAVKYLLNTNGLNVQLRENGFSYDVYEVEKVAAKKEKSNFTPVTGFELDNFNKYKNDSKYIFHRVDVDFLNSNPITKIVATGKSSDYDNYYTNSSQKNGITKIHKYQSIKYENIYNNIDVIFFIPNDKEKPVEYNFIIKPGGKISDINMKFNGTKTKLIDNKIRFNVRFGQMEETIPLSWKENHSQKEEISVNYKQIGKNTFGFNSSFETSDKTIIIDPVPIRLWGTYYGGAGDDFLGDITINKDNDVYISGATMSSNNIATAGTHLSSLIGNSNLFFTKFDTYGNRLWGTYFLIDNGIFNSSLPTIEVDSNNNLYFLCNELYNSNVATAGSFQPTKNAYHDLILAKLNDFGIREWATYYGGNGNEEKSRSSIYIDDTNSIYIAGSTSSTDVFATPGAHQTSNNSTSSTNLYDGFIAKFDTNGNRIWGTFYGGSLSDYFIGVFVSNDGFLYVCGNSRSNENIATPNSYQTTNPLNNSNMIVKFTLSGQRVWGTYLCDKSYMVTCKLKDDNLYFGGRTPSSTGIASSDTFIDTYPESLEPGSTLSNLERGYIVSFNVATQQKNWGSYFFDLVVSIDTNNSDEVYFSGHTRVNNGITTPDAYLTTTNNTRKSYIMKLNSFGQRIWGTYYGGNSNEQSALIKLDLNSDIYLFGMTYSNSGIATSGAHQPNIDNLFDIYLAKFRDCQSTTNATSNTPTCIGSNLELNATGGTNYLWNGPNGFTSTLQNPIITNVNSSHSGQYSCEITGTGDCDNTITIDVIVGDTLAPLPNLSNLPVINGDCNTVITNFPTANDNCSGTIIATTTSSLDFSNSGNYSITWNYDDGNGNTSTQIQNIVISQVALPSGNNQQTFCIQENATLNDILITGQNITWYDSQLNGNILANNTPLQNATNYYASQTINSCESDRIEIAVVINNTAPITGSTNQNFCSTENATLQTIGVNGTDILWYGSNTSTTPLPDSTLLIDNTTYFATQTLNGCESTTRLAVSINLINTLNANDYTESICDDLNDGVEIIDLTSYNSELIASNGNVFHYYHSLNGAENQITSDEIANTTNFELLTGNKIIYIRIDSPNTCFQIVELDLTLYNKPIIEINDIMPICDGNEITINAGNGFDNYNWSTGETTPSIIVSQPGNYDVTVSEIHGPLICTSTKNFTVVLSNPATITNIETKDWTTSENIIQIDVTGLGNYEYSLDNINFQDSNLFTNLPSGDYTIYVRDKNDCGAVDQKVYLLMYPLFFTPNGDGYNDKWKIKFSEIEPNMTVTIFDRYGKFIKQIGANSEGWDGTFLGNHLPSSDYWFIVTRQNGKEYRGHFSLKR